MRLITGEGSFIFNACNWLGNVYTATQKVVDHSLTLLCIIVGLVFGHLAVIGYDKTIQCDACGQVLSIWVDGMDYWVMAELFKSTALCRQVTRAQMSIKDMSSRTVGLMRGVS